MNSERWRRVTALFHDALERPPAQRGAFLEEACDNEPSLKADVQALLDGDDRAERIGDPLLPVSTRLTAGHVLGPYRIEAPLDAGGMGEIYTARDTRLNRTVAIKVLPLALQHDPGLRLRFEREAQAVAALNHPNICVLHDVGSHQGIDYLVMEHLDGETLERRLRKGALPIAQTLSVALEILDALASAHRAGITHRDLKPGNVMLTRSGAKLLDFGLAKFAAAPRRSGSATEGITTPAALTAEGMLVGTVQYMAPEQLEGHEADVRADLFSFGAVLYEMATGRKAFLGDSRTSLIAAILRDEPPAITTIQPALPPALDRVSRMCLAKDPDARFQSAQDVALQLRWIRDGALAVPALVPPRMSRPVALAGSIAVIVVAVVTGMAAFITSSRLKPVEPPSIRQMTFRRGQLQHPRFTPDGQTLVYSAAWDGQSSRVFSMRVDTAESVPLPVPDGLVMAVSRTGELAMLTNAQNGVGTLARVPLGGGGPREILKDVLSADWGPDADSLAVLREGQGGDSGQAVIEYPIGRRLYQTTSLITNLRVSPDGNEVGFVEYEGASGAGWAATVDRSGVVKRLSRQWPSVCGCLAWSVDGKEIWFSASEVGLDFGVHAVTRDGRERTVYRSMGSVSINDVAAGGRALMVSELTRASIVGLVNGEQHERDLSWLDASNARALSEDGRTLLFTEGGTGAGATPVVYVRQTDGSPAVRLAEGTGLALSPDGASALVRRFGDKHPTIMPIGPGQSRSLDIGSLEPTGGFYGWLPDGSRIAFNASEPGRRERVYVQSVTSGPPQAITPEGARLTIPAVVSPDSRTVLAVERAGKIRKYPTDGGTPTPMDGLLPGDGPLRWNADGTVLWILNRRSTPAQILRLDVATGKRTPWREIAFADPAGRGPQLRVFISADGRSYVYGFGRSLEDLFLVQGLK